MTRRQWVRVCRVLCVADVANSRARQEHNLGLGYVENWFNDGGLGDVYEEMYDRATLNGRWRR